MSVNSRSKGIRGELEACKLFRPYFPEVRRSFGQSRKGYEQPDLIGGGIEDRFFVEVKRVKKKYTGTDINRWADKLEADYRKYRDLTGKKSEYLVLMSRENRWHWELRVWQTKTVFEKITKVGETCDWERFVSFYITRRSPTKIALYGRDTE